MSTANPTLWSGSLCHFEPAGYMLDKVFNTMMVLLHQSNVGAQLPPQHCARPIIYYP